MADGVQSVERAFELLEIMASSGGSIALGELATRAELPQPTIHRLVRTLLTMGYVRQLENRRYATEIQRWCRRPPPGAALEEPFGPGRHGVPDELAAIRADG